MITEDGSLSLDTILKIGEILSILFGGALVFFKMGSVLTQVKEAIRIEALAVSELKEDVKVINRLLTDVAVQKSRLDSMDKRIDELRHGEGFVFPAGFHVQPAKT